MESFNQNPWEETVPAYDGAGGYDLTNEAPTRSRKGKEPERRAAPSIADSNDSATEKYAAPDAESCPGRAYRNHHHRDGSITRQWSEADQYATSQSHNPGRAYYIRHHADGSTTEEWVEKDKYAPSNHEYPGRAWYTRRNPDGLTTPEWSEKEQYAPDNHPEYPGRAYYIRHHRNGSPTFEWSKKDNQPPAAKQVPLPEEKGKQKSRRSRHHRGHTQHTAPALIREVGRSYTVTQVRAISPGMRAAIQPREGSSRHDIVDTTTSAWTRWHDRKPFHKDGKTEDLTPAERDGKRFLCIAPAPGESDPTYSPPASSDDSQPSGADQAPDYTDGYDDDNPAATSGSAYAEPIPSEPAAEEAPIPSRKGKEREHRAAPRGEHSQRPAPAPERGSDEKIERTSPAATKAEEEAKGLLDNGSTLYERGLLQEAAETYAEVVTRFGEAEEPALRVIVAKAIFNMGNALCKAELLEEERLWEEAIEAYTEVRTRFGEATEPALREVVAKTKRNLDMLCDLNDYQDGRKGRKEKGNYRRLEIDMTGSYFPYFQSWRYYEEFTASLLPLFSDNKNLGV
jgi:hypothetical protein